VLKRWFELGDSELPKADFLDIILYSKE
jgi:Protein of unknown function (DUF3228)